MLLVILGAGASYDSSASHPDHGPAAGPREGRIPMTDWLFDVAYNGTVQAAHAGRANPIVNLLRNRLSPKSIEELLDQFQSEAESYGERYSQLMAVRYYIRSLIRDVDGPWYRNVGATNHLTLFDEIRRIVPNDQPIAIVTFNYDRMADWALRDLGELPQEPTADFARYIQGRFKLFKVHGSVDWHRRAKVPGLDPSANYAEFVRQVIEVARDVEEGENLHYSDDDQVKSVAGEIVVPAIAVPLHSKQNDQMPGAHLEALEGVLGEVTQILCIGWRATDERFLELLKLITKPVYGAVVAATNAGAICTRLSGVLHDAELWPSEGGFSTFTTSGALQGFLMQAFSGTPNPRFSRQVTVGDPIATPAGPIGPGARGTLVTRHGTSSRTLRDVTVVPMNPYGTQEVRYEARGLDETVGFLPEHVISFDEVPSVGDSASRGPE